MKIITTDYENKKFWEETEKESETVESMVEQTEEWDSAEMTGIELIIQLSTNNKVLCNSRKQIHFSAEQ